MAKVYNCPICEHEFTTAELKNNGKLCPGCQTKLEHTIDGSGGTNVHKWVAVDADAAIRRFEAQKEIDEFEPRFNTVETGVNGMSQVWQEIKNPLHYVVAFYGRGGNTDLRCPECGAYLHTTNIINGSIQKAYCRNKVPIEQSDGSKKWIKCEARTDYKFKLFGVNYDPETDPTV